MVIAPTSDRVAKTGQRLLEDRQLTTALSTLVPMLCFIHPGIAQQTRGDLL
jgi:hypothetical protein